MFTSRYVSLWLRPSGLVHGSAATWRCAAFIVWTRWTLAMTSFNKLSTDDYKQKLNCLLEPEPRHLCKHRADYQRLVNLLRTKWMQMMRRKLQEYRWHYYFIRTLPEFSFLTTRSWKFPSSSSIVTSSMTSSRKMLPAMDARGHEELAVESVGSISTFRFFARRRLQNMSCQLYFCAVYCIG